MLTRAPHLAVPLPALRPSSCLQFMPRLVSAGQVRASRRPPIAALLCPTAPAQALAARMRPESLPAYEVLYKTAEEIAAKREELRRAAEAAKLKVGRERTGEGEKEKRRRRNVAVPCVLGAGWRTSDCCASLLRIPAAKASTSPTHYSSLQECLFHPVMVAEPKAKEGRALKLVAELTQVGSGVPPEQEEGWDNAIVRSLFVAPAGQRCPLLLCYLSSQAQQHAAALLHPAAAVQAQYDRGRGSGRGGRGGGAACGLQPGRQAARLQPPFRCAGAADQRCAGAAQPV